MVAEAIIVLFPPSHRLAFLIRFVFPNRTPFEHVLLVRQLALAGSCAITQIGSILASGEDTKKLPTEKEYAEVMSVLATQAERNLEVAKAIEAELAGIMASEVRAVVEGHKLAKGDPTKPVPKEEIDELRGRMSAAMVEVRCPRRAWGRSTDDCWVTDRAGSRTSEHARRAGSMASCGRATGQKWTLVGSGYNGGQGGI